MVGEERESNGCGNLVLGLTAENGQPVKKLKHCPVKVENDDANSAGSSGNVLRIYKRRKHTKVVEDGRVSGDLAGQIMDKPINKPLGTVLDRSSCTLASVAHVEPHGLLNGSSGQLGRNWKTVVLEQMFQSLENGGGLKKSIQDALASHEAGCVVKAKESGNCCDKENGCYVPSQFVPPGIQNGMKSVSNGSVDEPSRCAVTELCQHMFLDIVKSEKFAHLCNILSENFEGMKVDKLFDISLIHSRMKDGSYEGSPILFHSDIQQMWTKLHKIGSEMTSLSKSLSEISRATFQAQVGSLTHGNSGDRKNELDMLVKMEQVQACGKNKTCACRRCGEKADGRDCLVCDSCEDIYHVSCIEPAVTEIIPLRSWYCSKCTAKGIEAPHDNCVVCERLDASRSPLIEDVDELMTEDMRLGLEESSNGLVDDELRLFNGAKDLPQCNICRTEVTSTVNFRICGHLFCPHKFYHEGCLTKKQLSSYGSCWYCPSCLCRGCLKDCDDDKIVLCDGCDHAYHMYCMQPILTSIPRGKWFCRKCDGEIQRIRTAKNIFENLQSKLKQGAEQSVVLDVPKGKDEEDLNKSGGVDMLLNAAQTLNYQENLASSELKS